MFLKTQTTKFTENYLDQIAKLKELLDNADAIVIGAGAGLSTSAGLHYGGERFQTLFPDYIAKYKLTDMYSAAFYNHETLEEHWGYWCKHIYHNRYAANLNNTYKNLLSLVSSKNYFVITTNGDHQFRLNNFPKERLFYTQGDYGTFACSKGCHNKTYDNKEIVMNMIDNLEDLKIPTELIPYCPVCGDPMTVNLRKDGYFVEDAGWHEALNRYEKFISENAHKNIVFLELGVGFNTPSIIKYPFWQMTHNHKNAHYICLNFDHIECPKEIEKKSLCIKGDIKKILEQTFFN